MANKTKRHQGAVKRIKITARGKLLHRRPYSTHFLSKKRGSRKRQFAHSFSIEGTLKRKLMRILGD